MANLDTPNKRRSALPVPFTIPPVADGVIGAQDRAQADYMYSGIVYGGRVVETIWRPLYRPRRR